MTPADAKTIAEFLLSTIETEIPITTAVFRAAPEGRLDYRPDPVSKTALELMRHIALEDEWFVNAVADRRFGPFPDQSDACGVMTADDAAREYERRVRAAAGRVRTLSGEALLEEVDLMGAFRMPALQFLSLAVRHSTHHRGQLSAYLRAMGGKVPSIYGPSADSQKAVV